MVLGPFLHFYRNTHQFSSLKFSIFDIDGIDLYIVKYRFGSELLDKDVFFLKYNDNNIIQIKTMASLIKSIPDLPGFFYLASPNQLHGMSL